MKKLLPFLMIAAMCSCGSTDAKDNNESSKEDNEATIRKNVEDSLLYVIQQRDSLKSDGLKKVEQAKKDAAINERKKEAMKWELVEQVHVDQPTFTPSGRDIFSTSRVSDVVAVLYNDANYVIDKLQVDFVYTDNKGNRLDFEQIRVRNMQPHTSRIVKAPNKAAHTVETSISGFYCPKMNISYDKYEPGDTTTTVSPVE